MDNNNNNLFDTENVEFDPQDIEANKTMSMLAYILFFLPLVACKDSAFGKFHANQGLLVWILFIVSSIIGIIPILGTIVSMVLYVVGVIFVILGIVNTSKGLAKPLPIIGGITLIK